MPVAGFQGDRGNRVGFNAVTQTVAICPNVGCATGNRKAYGKRKKKQRNKGEIPLHETSPPALECASGFSSQNCQSVLMDKGLEA